MGIVTVRRVTQGFFLALALGLALVATYGEAWWQLRGWPTSWLLELDPLVALATLLATRTLYAGLLWALVTVVLTLLLGRVFCGWLCPLGTLQQIAGWLRRRGLRPREKVAVNQPHRAHVVKYYLLLLLLFAAAADLLPLGVRATARRPLLLGLVLLAMVAGAGWLVARRIVRDRLRAALLVCGGFVLWTGLGFALRPVVPSVATLQIGLLDPIPLFYRSIDLVALPLVEGPIGLVWAQPRHVSGALLLGLVFLAVLLTSLLRPRFYCRFVCPLGALLGLLARNALWRVGRRAAPEDGASGRACTRCGRCERDCEGACAPTERLRGPECVVCLNCVAPCTSETLAYTAGAVAPEHTPAVALSRRGFAATLAGGLLAGPLLRLPGVKAEEGHADLVRPPGATPEDVFLARCVKCGQCMRICPTNVLQPLGFGHGLERLWTPALDNRAGTSGCQPACVACSLVCPTGAIRRMTMAEKLGRDEFAEAGPIRLGTGFVDRGRCLPWAMDTPCLVCEENCPVSPKAIYQREVFQPLRGGGGTIIEAAGAALRVAATGLELERIGNGDFYAVVAGARRRIVGATAEQLYLESPLPPEAPPKLSIQVRLLQPYVDPHLCTGCGICEHVCPVAGRAAIRVTSENESREPFRRLVLPR